MELKNDLCSVQITMDSTYTVQSSDNRHYDVVLNPEHYTRSDLYKTLAIHIDLFSAELDLALVGDYQSYDFDCAILDGNILTVMQNDAISQICIHDGSLVLHKRFECFGCTFGLYRVPQGYIVYGELEVIMLDVNFQKVWSFSGQDIFVSQSKKPFVLCEHSIKLYDWEDNYYELDLEGNLIRDEPKKQ